MTTERQKLASELTLLKDKLMRVGLYRTGHLMELPIQEIGWELQGIGTPEYGKNRQKETVKAFDLNH